MEAVEASLLSLSRIPANSGGTLHKGTPREAFIREYLTDHLPQNLAIGSGEIIDAKSAANEQRPQLDLVLYRHEYPKLHLGGGVDAFLAESVIAIVEVKSQLTREEFAKSTRVARRVKQLRRNVSTSLVAGHQPPGIASYIVAFDGPASMSTVHGWIAPVFEEEGIPNDKLPPTWLARASIASPAVDGTFVLGRGMIQFDNTSINFASEETRRDYPEIRWAIADMPSGALLMFFLALTALTSSRNLSWLNPTPYITDLVLPNITLAP